MNAANKQVKIQFKDTVYYLHVVICFGLMFGFGYLEPMAPITEIGMRIIGIFLGLLYGWSFLGQIWPSLFGLLALVLSGYMPMKQVMASSFGNDTVVMMIFIFVFSAVIEACGLSRYISLWFITRKSVMGKPWIFTFTFLFSIYLLAALTSSSPAIILGWSLLYSICDVVGYKKGHGYPMFMIFGVVFASQLWLCMLPFKAVPMIILSAFEKLSGYNIDFLMYMVYAAIIGVSGLIILTLVGRFVLKPDVSLLKHITVDVLINDKNDLTMTRLQKIIFFFLIVLILLLMLPSILPANLLLSKVLAQLGSTGVVVLIVAVMVCLKLEGKPLLDFRKMANLGISWDVIMLIAAVMPISAALTSEPTGFTLFLVAVLDPILGGTSPVVFLSLVAIIAVIFTNLCNNAATAVALLPVAYTYSLTLGLNPSIAAAIIVICVHLAYLTPAASPSAALMHGNDWIDAKTIWTLGMILAVCCFITIIAVSLSLGQVLFG